MCIAFAGTIPAMIAAATPTILTIGLGAYGAIQQGRNAEAQADYQSAIAQRNATVADMQAQDAVTRGQIEEKQIRLRTASQIGETKSALSGAGVAIDSGTPLDLSGDLAAWGEYDVQIARWNTAKEVWGAKNQAAGYTAQSNLYQASGKNAVQSSYWDAASALTKGAGTISERW